ncbi:GAF domain-containing protein [Salegentibacter flavus]|uniref:GAF domain-containing protein n=1 Tax=Salegentibacter flavus TaxID=287099 RepID=A0A1I5A7Q8_9FLAO|nr:GAF domain-containing protein [Salegentibacter flavus]SFN58581.1 hypothetical protein SAMN05660413_01727 [Salegentibacter flavus]
MKEQIGDFPLQIKISFQKVIEVYKQQLENGIGGISREYIEKILEYIESFPQLTEGIEDPAELIELREPIKILLDDIFPNILSSNEIKTASVPYHNIFFNRSKRLKGIMQNAGEDFTLEMRNMDENMYYIQACIHILNDYYGYDIDFSRPLYYDIPDKNGIVHHYRIATNGDFVNLEPTDKAKKISEEDVDRLIQNFENVSVWKEIFPPQSWIFSGFVILNLTDVTMDEAISELKTTLLFEKASQKDELLKLQKIFRSIYKIPDLRVGFTVYNSQDSVFEKMEGKDAYSFILREKQESDCKSGLCEEGFRKLFEERSLFSIPNVKAYAQKNNNNMLSQQLLSNDVKSCILAPVIKNNKLLGILELVSTRKNELNSINTIKLDEILPYISTAVDRNRTEFENRIKAVIQSECTSIHPSVLWVFEKEAKKFIRDFDEDGLASFKDIVFKDIFPLYGQIDVVGSSEARNQAIQKDLLNQLKIIVKIIDKAYEKEKLPIYEQVKFRIADFRKELKESLNASSEQKVFNLLKKEVNPIMSHLKKQSPDLKEMVTAYQKELNPETGIIYNHRKNYDETVQQINRTMSRYIDRKQVQAQEIYPHYFERYKTDGVDHNIYIGASMAQNKPFNKVYLYNLRLWQLSTMIEMENRFYQLQEDTPIKLEAASLILVFNSTLSIRYRMDEKKFDVDGTYNARYEIIKKRIDKAFIKNTEERITQKGKIAIIYSQRGDEREYLRYIKYLQAKKYLGEEVEILELEDVQGVVGLKAIRVNILYTPDEADPEKTITYEDLMQELN